MANDSTLPRNFRTTLSPFDSSDAPLPSRDGLYALHASASAQFSVKSLKKMLNKIPSNHIIIVDLRQESHGFINGMAVSWHKERGWSNVGKTTAEVLVDESKRLRNACKQGFVIVYKNKQVPIPTYVKTISTEKQLTECFGLGYIRFGITDHLKPYGYDVDSFIEFAQSLPPNVWLHFHCSAGRGRSTTFMTMYDTMNNAKTVSLEDITRRQFLIGGINILVPPSPEVWKYPYSVERAEFIRKFYQYVKENPNFKQPWTTWIAKHPLKKRALGEWNECE